jgi:hypothetical protein
MSSPADNYWPEAGARRSGDGEMPAGLRTDQEGVQMARPLDSSLPFPTLSTGIAMPE